MLRDDTDLNPLGAKVTSIAYDRVESPPMPGNTTTLFGISLSSNSLVTIGRRRRHSRLAEHRRSS